MNAFLEEVRLRPGMWVRHSSLQHLDSMLTGYRVALTVHGVEEPFDFWNPGSQGAFTDWLWTQPGMPRASSLGWSTEIERAAERADRPAMEMFFELWDAFRATRQEAQLPQDARHQASDEPEEPAARD
ncbi:hypothetical protein [Streptomyces mirabilis]|uniref:Uncharacterized protein n=1 Tax=Streptomyces mirabilis TaxID=68239 RepID=A0ABU3UPK3_9ACTN|nr:hypothetical protein [Streptomyces mirabilis]MDU8995768.1 hypothetical protein [Streptomyces mirabilis]